MLTRNAQDSAVMPTVIRAADLAAYSPANHTGTSNVRVIGPETVGATAGFLIKERLASSISNQ